MLTEITRKSKGFIGSNLIRTEISPAVKLICTSISLFIVLTIIRANIIHLKLGSGISILTFIPRAFLSSYYDFLFVIIITIIFTIFLFLLGGKKKYQTTLYFLYTLIAFLGILAALLNKKAIIMIGSPLSYQWLYYSDFMDSQDAQNALLANASLEFLGYISILSLLMFLLAKLFIYLYRYFNKGLALHHVKWLLFISVLIISYSFLSIWYHKHKKLQYNKFANPISFFIQSMVKTNKNTSLFLMEVNGKFEDLPSTANLSGKSLLSSGTQNKIKNVIIFVLESVPAEYVDAYGGKFNVTPELNKLIPHSVRFTKAYAHSPSTNNSMISILGSVYPWISYKSLTREYPEIKLNSISNLLKRQHYRTAFYSAADLKYQRAGEYLKNQRFDVVEDFSSTYCRGNQFIVKGKRWENPDGADDECMVNSFNDWIDTDITKPFFATLWTVQTHYPYFYSGKEKDYQVNNTDLNRYLNALKHSDQTLGKLVGSLKKRGLEESTLLVIVGDHGEAFGRHDQRTHASKIYEENVHVPLLFVNRQLFNGESKDLVSGHIDIAPTIMNILRSPVDENWQGHNLLNGNKNNRTYFFAPWSEFLFGFREDNIKFIYNATNNTSEIYDLEKDPTETKNLADKFSQDYIVKGHQQLAKWIQYQNKFIKTSLKK